MINNPFILYGYESEKYFCDRKEETAELKRLVTNGNNVALIAPRRIGKTGLIENLFHQRDIANKYYTFLIDIYATKNFEEMVLAMSTTMLAALRPRGAKVMQRFVDFLTSLRTGVSFDAMGNPSWNLEIGNIKQPRTTLDEIFRYISEADKPCIVAIDEFQTVSNYSDTNVEALLRTYIQHCRNAQFIFSGSQRTMMGEIFVSPSRPFYQSATLMSLSGIPQDRYCRFASSHFAEAGKRLHPETFSAVYQQFDGITWYLQRVLNELFSMTAGGEECTPDMVPLAINNILRANEFAYQSTLFQLPPKQKELLVAICKEGKAQNLTSSAFIRKYHLPGSSSVQSAIKGLLEKTLSPARWVSTRFTTSSSPYGSWPGRAAMPTMSDDVFQAVDIPCLVAPAPQLHAAGHHGGQRLLEQDDLHPRLPENPRHDAVRVPSTAEDRRVGSPHQGTFAKLLPAFSRFVTPTPRPSAVGVLLSLYLCRNDK